jgi:hypothetical protein
MLYERLTNEVGSEAESSKKIEIQDFYKEKKDLPEAEQHLVDLWTADQDSKHFLAGRTLEEARHELTSLREERKQKTPTLFTQIFHRGDITIDFASMDAKIEKLMRVVSLAGKTHTAYDSYVAKYFLDHKLEEKGVNFEEFKQNPIPYLDVDEPQSFKKAA